MEKVPSDIEVARAQVPKDVSIIASEVGLLSSEVDLFGKKKAKVSLSTLKRLEGRKNGKYVVVAGIKPICTDVKILANRGSNSSLVYEAIIKALQPNTKQVES